jgi:molybdenum cofactor cytidylyltransferase
MVRRVSETCAMNVAAVVLAAGSSRRLGAPKQLLALPSGESLLARVIREVCTSRCRHVSVVLPPSLRIDARVLHSATLLANEAHDEGMSSSIRCGVRWARRAGAGALLVVTCDQWKISRAHVNALACVLERGVAVVASRYRDVLGVPAGFSAALFGNLLELRGDEGAKQIVRAASDVEAIDWPEGASDVDTPADAVSLRALPH